MTTMRRGFAKFYGESFVIVFPLCNDKKGVEVINVRIVISPHAVTNYYEALFTS